MRLKQFFHHLNSVLCLQIILIAQYTKSHSHIWGRVHPQAVQIYDLNLRMVRESPATSQDAFVDIQYPKEGTVSKYIITMIMVFNDEELDIFNSQQNEKNAAFIITGGIGLNYTSVRFPAIADENNFNFVIYGVNPQLYEYI